MSKVDSGHIETARGMAETWADDNLDSEEASEAVEEASVPSLSDVLGSSEFLSGATRAQTTNSAMRVVSLVVALTVGAIVAAFLLPIGLDELVAADTGNWSDGAQALWNILDVIVVLAVFLFFIGIALSASSKV